MEQQDKFLEYTQGKVFLISWINGSGDEVTDRWVAFGKDAEIVFNYLKSSDPKSIELVRFKPYSYLNETEYEVAFALNSELDIDNISFIIGDVIPVRLGARAVDILNSLMGYIHTMVGGHNGN